jgi:16S rRNA (guanine966-N2)-methyltransferase
MRVTGGILCSRQLHAPPGGVRPTQDRVREALFSILGDRVAGARFLDLCAGSGAVGLEAWSRGADFVCWVESDRRVFGVLRRNVEGLCDGRTRLILAEAGRYPAPGCAEAPFDLVYVDPPYAGKGRPAMLARVFTRLAEPGMLRDGGMVILEQGAEEPAGHRAGWHLDQERTYGRARLCFYNKEYDARGRVP